MTLPTRRKRVLLWCLSVATLASFGVEHALGVQGDDVTTKVAATAAVEPGSGSSSGGGGGSSSSDMTTRQDYSDEGEQQQDISLCLLLIVRDEEESLQKNLPLWREVADCFVIGVDERTTDRTAITIHEVLGDDTER